MDETTTSDPLMNGHLLNLRPQTTGDLSLRMTFRRAGEDVPLWQTGVGAGELISQGTLPVAGTLARTNLKGRNIRAGLSLSGSVLLIARGCER